MSTYSPILRTELIGAGQQPGTWGDTTNSNFQYVFESAIAGYVAVTVTPTSNNQVLTYVNGPSASAALNQSVYGILKLNAGTLGANFNIFAPPVSKTYVVWNNTSYTATFYNSTVIGNTTAAGSGAVIPAGAKVVIWSDGSSFYGNDTAVGNFNVAGNLTVTGTATFTGIPSGPTAAAGTNTTQLATTAFVLANNFPSGTRLTFNQAAAPTFWTQDTSDTANNRMMRVVATAGGGVGGAYDPTVMNVVPAHYHSFNTNGTDINHTHFFSAYTGGQTASHTHSSGSNGAPNGGGAGAAFTNGQGNFPGQTTTAASNDHAHFVQGDTGYMNGGGTHSHSGSTDNGSSQTNWTPRYVNLIICQKN